jgi:polyisoprenyl-phosphate glycosyltransferase
MDTRHAPLISVVVPAHNEAQGIAHATGVIGSVLDGCGLRWEIVVVDDGSRDGTFDRVAEIARGEPRIKGLRFSRNFGKEAALLAGLAHAAGDAVITIDADLQHPPALIPQMVEHWRSGAKVVDAVKRSRDTDGWLTRLRARVFNALLTRLGGIRVENSSDFKLLDRVVVDTVVRLMPERRRFYRGLTEWVGYPRVSLPFYVAERHAGDSKWSLWKLIELALTATISFTSAPLRIVTVLGFGTLAFGFVVGAEAIIGWARGLAVSGFTTTIATLLIIGSTIMISLGIIGEYIAKIYDEIKARPAYLVDGVVGIGPAPQAGEAVPVQAPAAALPAAPMPTTAAAPSARDLRVG